LYSTSEMDEKAVRSSDVIRADSGIESMSFIRAELGIRFLFLSVNVIIRSAASTLIFLYVSDNFAVPAEF